MNIQKIIHLLTPSAADNAAARPPAWHAAVSYSTRSDALAGFYLDCLTIPWYTFL